MYADHPLVGAGSACSGWPRSVPLVVFGVWGGAVSDAVDRRRLLLASSLLMWASTLGLLVQAVLGPAPAGPAARPDRGAGDGVRDQLADPQRDHSAAGADAGDPGGEHAQLRRRSMRRWSSARCWRGLLVRTGEDRYVVWAYLVDAVAFTVAALGHLAAAQPADRSPRGVAGRTARPARVAGWRGDPGRVRLHRRLPGAAALVRHRHRGHGAGPAAVAVPAGGRRAVRVGLDRLAVRGDRASARWWPGSPPAGSVGSTGRASPWWWRWWCGGWRSRAAGLAGSLWLAVLLLAVGGAADLVSAVYRQSILQTYAPDGLQGRMQGVFIAVVAGGPRLGDLRAGVTADLVGPTVAWVGGGIAAAVVAGGLALAFPALLRYTPRPAPPGAQPSVRHRAQLAVSLARWTHRPRPGSSGRSGPAHTRPCWSRSAAGCAPTGSAAPTCVDGYAESELCPGSRRPDPRPVAQPDPRRSLHVRRRGVPADPDRAGPAQRHPRPGQLVALAPGRASSPDEVTLELRPGRRSPATRGRCRCAPPGGSARTGCGPTHEVTNLAADAGPVRPRRPPVPARARAWRWTT